METLFNFPTFAVIPSALGPLQALMAILPHLLVVLGTALIAISKPKTYRTLIRYCWAHKGLTLMALAPVGLFFFSGSIFGVKAIDEKGGASWTAFRGGPERNGAVPGSRGPFENARVLWNYFPSGMALQEIDSSPTVVGNRVYFGASLQTPLKKAGSITCLDTETGAVVWQYRGEGMDRPIQPVFSSPAVGGGTAAGSSKDPGKVQSGADARYLVSGEGYHEEQNARILCLDLERVRSSGGKQPPEFKWSVQTTSHVETGPAIFENKVYAGAGDDGWWCIDLETGKVIWRLEGNAYYVINEGPQVEALAKMAGKTVAVNGTPKRYRLDVLKDFSVMFLDATSFTEVQPGTTMVLEPAQADKTKDLRTIIGKVVVTAAVNNPEQKGSRVTIEMEKVYADAECPPVALRIDGQPRLFCGSGLDGQSVICIDAENGKEIWRTKTSDPVFSAPTVVGEVVYVGLSNGTYVASAATPAGSVIALSAADGKLLWECKTADGVLGAVAVHDGKAYACSRDGSLYVADAKDGRLIKKYDTGSAMVCSPAVTAAGVYVATNSGKVFGINRESVEFQWSLNLTPGKEIYSSPCAAGNRLFIGTKTRGLVCIGSDSEGAAVRRPIPAWGGPGGNAEQSNVADERGAPAINGNKSDRISEDGKITTRPLVGPMAASGNRLYFSGAATADKPRLVCVNTSERNEIWHVELSGPLAALAANESTVFVYADAPQVPSLSAIKSKDGVKTWSRTLAKVDRPALCATATHLIVNQSNTAWSGLDITTGADAWKAELGTLVGAPALKHGLLFTAISAPKPQLICLDDSSGAKLWNADLAAKPLSGPSVSGDKVFIALAGKGDSGAKIICRKLTDGSAVWECDVEKAPVTPLALSGEHLAFTVSDGTVIVLETVKGEQTHTVLLGKGGQAPAIYENTLFLGADDRVGAYDLSGSSWLWGYRDQKTTGHVWTAPILAGEAVWVSTEKQGVIAIGGKTEKK